MSIKKILVANRGEIAVRVMRTCKRLGIRTVAVYSEVDAGDLFVRLADEAVLLGPAPATASYLRGDLIVSAALSTGCDAVHPGYGFLSEREAFARAVEQAGLIFIGPTPESMQAMGLKIQSKLLLQQQQQQQRVGVAAGAGDDEPIPLIPGYEGAAQDVDTLTREAIALGFPVLLKASAGGGGKGMRIVRSPAELASAVRQAQSEAANAFGDASLLIERYFDDCRHVEFQIFGDTHGNVVHMFERECSVQRRYQKVVEESPSPCLTPELRGRMARAAVAIGRAVRYRGAGTVEFIVDAATLDGSRAPAFYFLEMNTRLQVEHPVTELLTGLDLVELQIRVAEGANLLVGELAERMPWVNAAAAGTRDVCAPAGHALEVRLYAEDPANGFLPSTGTLVLWRSAVPRESAVGRPVRYDTGVESGSTVSIYYDPMIAKISVFGETRDAAIDLMLDVLADTVVCGVQTNKAFLAACLAHAVFRSGAYTTGFIEKYLPAPARAIQPVLAVSDMDADVVLAAVVTAWLERTLAAAASGPRPLAHLPRGWRSCDRSQRQEQRLRLPDGSVATVRYRSMSHGPRRTHSHGSPTLVLPAAFVMSLSVPAQPAAEAPSASASASASAPLTRAAVAAAAPEAEVEVVLWEATPNERGVGQTLLVQIGATRRRYCTCALAGRNAADPTTLFVQRLNCTDAGVAHRGQAWSLSAISRFASDAVAGAEAAGSGAQPVAPMPGRIVEVLVKVGDVLTKGAPVAVIESMKMQTTIASPRDGVCVAVVVAKGQLIEAGALIAKLQSSDDEPAAK